jgi:pimeloyl-ACP methyl ester carboxylesterase
MSDLKRVSAGDLDVAYFEAGPADGRAVILLHGFPYDALAYEEVMSILADRGRRCIAPFLRGYGPTRFLRTDTMRSGQQAALGADLLALMDALQISSAAGRL